ncbi:hypothetical protein Avbf_12900 [Armadillidium vulgare]|nr:hypothetical protein Avbf_12900 [Armadillidium vulgare]
MIYSDHCTQGFLNCIINYQPKYLHLQILEMESENFQFHESGETIDKSLHGKDFEKDFGKFLLFRLICQRENFQNFRFTREKKGTGKFDDFVFVYDSDDGKTKYSLIQLKHLSDENKKINFEDLKANSKSYFGLPYYFDYYTKSLSCLSNDKDLKEAELEGLLFCTNAGIEDSLGCISKREILNEGLFRNSGKLYKLSINDKERQEIFREQFLSERKRLANELAFLCYAEQNPHLKKINKNLYKFRKEFFDSLFEFHKKFPRTRKIKSKELRSSFPIDRRDIEKLIEFLREKTITISTITEQKTLKRLSQELVLSVMLQKPFNILSNIHDRKTLRKLIELFREEVIDLDAKKLKEKFLTANSRSDTELNNFRQCFFKDVMIFCENLKYTDGKELEEFLKFFNSNLNIPNFAFSLKFILEKGRNGVIEILKDREIKCTSFPDDIETCTEIFPSGKVDATEIDKNIVKFLNLLTFAVNQNDFTKSPF